MAKVTEQEISSLMVGRDVMLEIKKSKPELGDKILEVKNLSKKSGEKLLLNDVSLSIRSGEIMGVAGVEGNGQRELVNYLTGKDMVEMGKIFVDGQDIGNHTIRQIRDKKVSHIPEDRMVDGAASSASIAENMISTKIDSQYLNKGLLMNRTAINQMAEKLIEYYRIKCDGSQQLVGMLSGGNIQKVVAARELASKPRLIIANQPARGVDVSAAEFIHDKLLELRGEGSATLLVSADLNEVLGLSDSLIVMYDGEIAAYFKDSSKVSELELGMYMLGSKKMNKEEIGGLMDE